MSYRARDLANMREMMEWLTAEWAQIQAGGDLADLAAAMAASARSLAREAETVAAMQS